MTAVIRWQDPPERGDKRNTRLKHIADELRKSPGKWAVVHEGGVTIGGAAGLAYRIRTATAVAFAPAGSFEARCVGPATGPAAVYARYVGEAAS